jgi:hypothetical protein
MEVPHQAVGETDLTVISLITINLSMTFIFLKRQKSQSSLVDERGGTTQRAGKMGNEA